MQEKYIDLILEKCIYPYSENLYVSYNKENEDFILKLIEKAKIKGFKKILKTCIDVVFEHQLLETLSVDEIKQHPYFYDNNKIEAAENKYVFLMATTAYPGFFDDIDSEKLIAVKQIRNLCSKKYLDGVMDDSISWTIFPLPNQFWAEKLFQDDKSYEKLEQCIYSSCMLYDDNPIEKWQNYIDTEVKKTEYLNNLNIKQLVFKNSLGTDLRLSLADDYIFRSLENNHCIENLPTYSIWTTPHKYKVEGMVYGSLPITQSSIKITNYWFKFQDGKLCQYDAESGKEFLDQFINSDEGHRYLGEIALSDANSPISKYNMSFNFNLLDENIATHFALGMAYPNTVKNGVNLTKEQLDKKGCNLCYGHLDFTIGTNDLNILAYTSDGRQIQIYKNGCFDYDLIGIKSPF